RNHHSISEQLCDQFQIRSLTASSTSAREFKQRLLQLLLPDAVYLQLSAIHFAQAQEEIPVLSFDSLLVCLPFQTVHRLTSFVQRNVMARNRFRNMFGRHEPVQIAVFAWSEVGPGGIVQASRRVQKQRWIPPGRPRGHSVAVGLNKFEFEL